MQFVEVVSESELSEGTMQAVHVEGKRALIALVEGKPYALGAVCTHERANLDEGTLMGHEIYCPLHFSCFDLRTGEALAPPADQPTPLYAVKIENGKVLVSTTPVDPATLEALRESVDPAALEALREPEPVETPPTAATTDRTDSEPARATAETLPTSTATEAGEAAAVDPATERERTTADAQPVPAVATPSPGSPQARMIRRIEEMSWLEGASRSLGSALRPVRESRAGGRLFDLLHGRIVGHALHPALSDLPIGLWSGAVILDLFGEHTSAGILAAAGIVGGLGAAATGVADWTVSDGADRRVGLLHGILQTVALVIVGGSVVLRFTDATTPAQILMIGGLGVSVGSAYLGGHLVLGRGVMVDRTAWQVGPRQWTRALPVADLAEGDAKPAEVDGRQVLVSFTDGSISVIENACTHAGGPLSMGRIENGVVRCPWHGSCFRLSDGAVVRGPAAHPQPMLEARVRDGMIEVRGRRR